MIKIHMIMAEALHRFYCLIKRSKGLHRLVMKLVEIYGKASKVWSYQPPNYLGRTYLTKRVGRWTLTWYLFERYGVKWER